MNYSKRIKNLFKKVLNQLPYVKTLYKLNANSQYPAGHYYSTVISLDDIRERQDDIWKKKIPKNIKGIELQTKNQLSLLETLSTYYPEFPFPNKKTNEYRYFYQNSYYAHTDAVILFTIIRYFEPQNIIEVGSGFSSALMLDMKELFNLSNLKLSFIEPYAEDRLKILIKNSDSSSCKIISKGVQQVSLDFFKKLEEGDILFIDSTHVIKTGSDVNYILFEIFPVLKPGVLIHFHDIHFPFEYPKEWVLNGIGWNETYFLRAFLMYNKDFEIIMFTDYLQKFYLEAFDSMPIACEANGSNLWLRKK